MTDFDLDFSELDLSFAGRVPDISERIQWALAPLGVVGIIESPQFLKHSTAVSVILTGVEGKSVDVGDEAGVLKSLPVKAVVNEQLFAEIAPEIAFLDYDCVYGTPRPEWDQQEELQSWTIISGLGLRADHLVIASVKDRSARWKYWEENGCGFARYEGENRFHQLNFLHDSGTVIELIPSEQELSATIFAKGQRVDMDFSAGLVPITRFAVGSPADERIGTILATWSGFTSDTLEQLVEMTGNRRAAAELQRSQRNGAGLQGLLELLRNLGIGASTLDYALNGNFPDNARSIEPRGMLDRVRLVREENELRTGTKPSFFGALKQFKAARRSK